MGLVIWFAALYSAVAAQESLCERGYEREGALAYRLGCVMSESLLVLYWWWSTPAW